MKVHETNGGSKRKHDEMEEDDEALKKYLIKCINECEEEKIALGKRVYWILGQGVGSEDSLPEEIKDALNIYMKHAQELNNYRVSRKKVYPFAANLVNIKYKYLTHLSHTIG